MGLYDREYYRNDPRPGGLMGGVGQACKWLIAINAAVFVLQLLTREGRGWGVTEWLMLDPVEVLRHWQLWRILTCAFCHDPDSLWHLLFNMLFLWMCGSQVEAIYGMREFVRFYLAAAIFSGLCFLLFAFAFARPAPMLGASGAVMAVTVVCAMYYPTQKVLFFFVIPIELRWLVILSAIFDVYPLLREMGGAQEDDRVAHVAHLGGLVYGFLYKRFDLRFSRLLPELRWPRFRQLVRNRTSGRSSNVKLYQPPDDARAQADLERQVDAILAKITSEGEGSLTDAERAVLKEASRRYKRR